MESMFKKGQLVKSKSGRDKSRHFLILEVVDDDYVLLVDGDLRKLAKPKKKKIIHLQIINKNSVILFDKEELNDSHIRKEIANLIEYKET
jgi:ribosomal protein L14E/L6E/L27E